MSEPPSWGVLVRAPLHQVAAFLRAARPSYEVETLSFRHNAEWTAAFYMEPAPGGETDAAPELRAAGFHAIHLNFDRDRYRVHRWSGRGWAWTGESPVVVCAEAGIQVPGHAMPTLPARPFHPTRVRAIGVVENMTADAVARVRGESDLPNLIEQGPRGALVTMHPWLDEPTFGDLSERVPNRVFHLEVDPVDGRSCA